MQPLPIIFFPLLFSGHVLPLQSSTIGLGLLPPLQFWQLTSTASLGSSASVRTCALSPRVTQCTVLHPRFRCRPNMVHVAACVFRHQPALALFIVTCPHLSWLDLLQAVLATLLLHHGHTEAFSGHTFQNQTPKLIIYFF